MAKGTISASTGYKQKPKKKGSAAKTKTSPTKASKLYKKPYNGQG
jgi:hypothetical protein